jgi:GT2 family glycosyltransferase
MSDIFRRNNKMYKVFCVIVTYNGSKWIRKCLESIRNSSTPINTIVVDNNSNDDTLKIIKNGFPEVTIIESSENLGFGRANNAGIESALLKEADFVLLLNQDAYLQKDMLSKMIAVFESNPEYGVLSPLQMDGEGNRLDKKFSNSILHIEEYVKDPETFITNPSRDIFETKFVMAAIWFMTGKCVKLVGGFNPLFAHYGEDNDYLDRVRFFGLKVGICPKAQGFHDRDYRVDSLEKVVYLKYIAYLYILSNINKKFILCFNRFVWVSLRVSLKMLFKLKLKLVFVNIVNTLKIIGKLRIIKESRHFSQIEGAFLN